MNDVKIVNSQINVLRVNVLVAMGEIPPMQYNAHITACMHICTLRNKMRNETSTVLSNRKKLFTW